MNIAIFGHMQASNKTGALLDTHFQIKEALFPPTSVPSEQPLPSLDDGVERGGGGGRPEFPMGVAGVLPQRHREAVKTIWLQAADVTWCDVIKYVCGCNNAYMCNKVLVFTHL